MNLNNFMIVPNKPKSVKLNARNLRELRMETLQLDLESKDVESRLQQLRDNMSREKEERERSSGFWWKSGQTGTLSAPSHSAKRDKENGLKKLSAGKMKIAVLKDEPLPELQRPVERVFRPAVAEPVCSRNSKLKLKVCGQCEARAAGLMCPECGENYCISCFARFHHKGALRFHRMIPIQAGIQTSVSTLDVVRHFQRQVSNQESVRGSVPRATELGEVKERRVAALLALSVPKFHTHDAQVLVVNQGDVVEEEKEEEELRASSTLLIGHFDEEESAKSFQEALNRWRGQTDDTTRPTVDLPLSVEAVGIQAELMEGKVGRKVKPIQVEFRQHGMSYMEKLLLKKLRKTLIEDYRTVSSTGPVPNSLAQPASKTDEESQELSAEELELHRYCASLFAVSTPATEGDVRPAAESSLRIVEFDEVVTDAMVNTKFAVESAQGSNKAMLIEGGEDSSSVALQNQSLDEIQPAVSPHQPTRRTHNVAESVCPGLFTETTVTQPPVPLQPSSQTLLKTHSPKPHQVSLQTAPSKPTLRKSPRGDQVTTQSPLKDQLKIPSPKTNKFLKTAKIARPVQPEKSSRAKVKLSPSPSSSRQRQHPTRRDYQDSHDPLVYKSPPRHSSASPRGTSKSPEDHFSRSRLTSYPLNSLSPPSFYVQSPSDPQPPSINSAQIPLEHQSSKSQFSPSPQNPSPAESFHARPLSDLLSSMPRVSDSPSGLPSCGSSTPPCLSPRALSLHYSQAPLSLKTRPEIELPSSCASGSDLSPDEMFNPPELPAKSEGSPGTVASSLMGMSDSDEEILTDSLGMIPSEDDSSDEEMRKVGGLEGEEERRQTPALFPSPNFDFAPRHPSHLGFEATEHSIFAEPSRALHSIAQLKPAHPLTYCGLDGFFTLSVDHSSVEPRPAPPHKPRDITSSFDKPSLKAVGEDCWRPSSSFRHCADEQLVTRMVSSQSVGYICHSATPAGGVLSAQRWSLSDKGTPISTCPPSLPMSRPLSRAAQEILEVQSVERAITEDDDDDDDDADFLALANLEEEFRQISTEPDSYKQTRGTQSWYPV